MQGENVQDFYTEKYKALLRKIEDNLNKMKRHIMFIDLKKSII